MIKFTKASSLSTAGSMVHEFLKKLGYVRHTNSITEAPKKRIGPHHVPIEPRMAGALLVHYKCYHFHLFASFQK